MIRRISVIAPMLNESSHVENLVRDLAAQDFDGTVKIFVADGGSTDGSPGLLRRAAEAAGLDVTVLENPRRTAAAGLNVCLPPALAADPDLVVRLDCHAQYPADYLRRAAEVSAETGAWNVGGLFEPAGDTPAQRAIAVAFGSPFGGHNWTRRSDRHDADTVFCGAFLPDVFRRVGSYDEHVGTAEVEDLNLRIREAGGRVVYDPSIHLTYLVRPSFRRLAVQYYRYGVNKTLVTAKHRQVVSPRALVPLVFVASLGALGAASAVSPAARRLLAAELGLYAAAATAFATRALAGSGESWSLLPRVLAVFPILHVTHGAGGLHGWLRVARSRRRGGSA